MTYYVFIARMRLQPCKNLSCNGCEADCLDSVKTLSMLSAAALVADHKEANDALPDYILAVRTC